MIGFITLTLAFAWLARRVLGAARVSWVRAIVAGILGVVVGAAVGVALVRSDVNDDSAAAGVAIVTALLLTMGLIVALQLLSAPRHSARRRVGIAGSLRVARRTSEVLRIAARHGLGPYVGRRRGSRVPPSGAQLRAALEESGVVFVKFGQLLASRPDLVGPAIAAELGSLRHRVTPLSRDIMEAVVRAEVPDFEAVFESIDWEPLGSASIAQVYAATLTDGAQVVIKVRRPGIDEEVNRDGNVVRNVMRPAERHSAWARAIGIADLARSFVTDLEGELDYPGEARNAADLAAAFDGTDVNVPVVHAELTGTNLLVMERVRGVTLAGADLDRLVPDIRRQKASALVGAHVAAMLDGGRFHADPHPGNVMLTNQDDIYLIDFGEAVVAFRRDDDVDERLVDLIAAVVGVQRLRHVESCSGEVANTERRKPRRDRVGIDVVQCSLGQPIHPAGGSVVGRHGSHGSEILRETHPWGCPGLLSKGFGGVLRV